MSGKNKSHMTALAAWVGRDLLPPVVRWLEAERLPLEARAIQARARRAMDIGEIDGNVHACITMNTGVILRWCWANGAGVKTSAWIEPNGQINPVEYGQHWNWIKAQAQRLDAEGVADEGDSLSRPAHVAMKMMKAGWIRYSGGTVMTFPMPNAAQAASIDALLRESSAPEGFLVQFFIEGAGARGEVPAQQVVEKGTAQVLAELAKGAPETGEEPFGKHRLADAGGGTDGPFQQGDGQETQNSYMETLQDGSTAPIERGIEFMPQDFQPEVWWNKNLLDYLNKSYPGKISPGPQSDSDTISGFAAAVDTVTRAVENMSRRNDSLIRQADMTDPSDTDGQHDQLEGFETHLVDPTSILYREDKGLQAPTREMKTHLGGIWRQRRSDKGVENQIIQMEKNHLEPDEIKQELRTEGIPGKVIDETYENREKNLFKVVEVGG